MGLYLVKLSDRQYLAKVAALGCVACRIQGTPGTPSEIHHPRSGQGLSQRADHKQAIALCPAHHRGTMHPAVPSIHLDKLNFIEQFGDEEWLIEYQARLLNEAF